MFYGRADASSQDVNSIISNFYDTKTGESWRLTGYIADASNQSYYDT